MAKLRLIIRLLLTPLWLALFFVYLPIWYIQMSWYYFRFSDYWEGYLLLWDRIMIFLKSNNSENWRMNYEIKTGIISRTDETFTGT